MDTFKILIVEDEVLIAESLKLTLINLGYQVPAIFTSGAETLKSYYPGFADIVIMDIHLAGNMNGIDTSVAIGKISSVPIIFITNSKDENIAKKAIKDANAVYYLSKPFSKLDIMAAIDIAIKSLKTNEIKAKEDKPSYLLNDCIFVKHTHGFKKLLLKDILFLKAEGSYCELMFKDSKITFSENLSFFEDKFAFAKEMVRIHRSFIVNINCISRVHENRVWINNTEIPIGKTYKNTLNELMRFF